MDTRDLETIDIDQLNGYQLVEYVADVHRLEAQLEAMKLKAVDQLAYCPPGDADSPPDRTEIPGDRAVGALEAHCGLTRYMAGVQVALAMDLADPLSETLKALEAGELDLASARAISERSQRLSDPLERRRVEAAVLDYVRDALAKGLRRTANQIRQATDAEVLRVDPDAAEKRHKKRVEDRSVWIRPGEDCAADIIIGNISVDQAAQVYGRIDKAARHTKANSDERTLAQLRADFATTMLDGTGRLIDTNTSADVTPAVEADRRAGGRIVLTASLTDLANLTNSTLPAKLGWVGAIGTEVARRMVPHHLDNPGMEYTVAVTDANGRITQLHSLSRTFVGQLRSTVQVIRPECDWFTCTKPAIDCELDHSIEYRDGGPTSLGNGRPKCKQHHREKNENGWTDIVDPDTGEHRGIRSPHGHQYPDDDQPSF